MNTQVFRSTALALATAVTTLVAVAQPQQAVSAEPQLSAGIVPAQRFRAADNGSADVQVARPAALTESSGEASELAAADTAHLRMAERKVGFGDRKVGFGDRKVGFGDRKVDFGDRKVGFGDRKIGFGDRKVGFGDRKIGFGDRKVGFGDLRADL